MIDAIESLPNVSFIGNATLDVVKQNMRVWYKDAYYRANGVAPSVEVGSLEWLLLDAISVELFHVLLYVDRAGKMNLLKYAYGEYLDNLAALKGLERKGATAAVTTVRFFLDEPMGEAVPIPQGTRVKGGGLYFSTDEYGEITAGSLYADIPVTCAVTGTDGNGIAAGDIGTLVDPVAYVNSVESLDETSGGADEEDDDELAERIYITPDGYSTAGPVNAYKAKAKSYSSAVGSVVVLSPEACKVEVYVLMADGSLPTQSVLDGISDLLSGDENRPLTDLVEVKAPDEVGFEVSVKYWINTSDSPRAVSIQTQVAAAVSEYVEWQSAEMGRDINPSQLSGLVMDAGAKRCEVTLPVFTEVPEWAVARALDVTVVYGGLEDD